MKEKSLAVALTLARFEVGPWEDSVLEMSVNAERRTGYCGAVSAQRQANGELSWRPDATGAIGKTLRNAKGALAQVIKNL